MSRDVQEVPKKRFHVNRMEQISLAGKYNFEISDRRYGLVIARCWSRRIANKITQLLNAEAKP